jgi:hypothetical protein
MDGRMVSLNSVFNFVSEFCSDSVDILEKESVISFGFRTMNKDRDSQINFNSNVDKADYPNISPVPFFPMSYFTRNRAHVSVTSCMTSNEFRYTMNHGVHLKIGTVSIAAAQQGRILKKRWKGTP